MPAARRLAKIDRGSLGVTHNFLLDNQFERILLSNDGRHHDGAQISASKHASRIESVPADSPHQHCSIQLC